jgi:hypothetical protein
MFAALKVGDDNSRSLIISHLRSDNFYELSDEVDQKRYRRTPEFVHRLALA